MEMERDIPACPECGATSIRYLMLKAKGNVEMKVAEGRDSLRLVVHEGKALMHIGCGECGAFYDWEAES